MGPLGPLRAEALGIAQSAASCVSVQSLVRPIRGRSLLSATSLAGGASWWPGQLADEGHRYAIQHVAVEFPFSLPQSLASSSVAVRPACAVRRRKSASSWSSASPYSAQIWSIEVFIPE